MRILASLCVAVLLLGLVSLRVDASELQAALEEEIDPEQGLSTELVDQIGGYDGAVSGFGARCLSLLGATLGSEVRISGPYAPAIDKIAGQHFRHIRLTMAKDKHLGEHKKLLAETLAAFEKERSWNGHFAIDVDPV